MFVVAGLALAFASGRLDPHFVDDSPSYVNYKFESLEAVCRAQRMPGYPLWLLVFTKTIGIAFVPAAQVVVHATASWLLFRELGQWGLSDLARLAAAIAVGIGCTAMDHVGTVSTDAVGAMGAWEPVVGRSRIPRISSSNRLGSVTKKSGAP